MAETDSAPADGPRDAGPGGPSGLAAILRVEGTGRRAARAWRASATRQGTLRLPYPSHRARLANQAERGVSGGGTIWGGLAVGVPFLLDLALGGGQVVPYLKLLSIQWGSSVQSPRRKGQGRGSLPGLLRKSLALAQAAAAVLGIQTFFPGPTATLMLAASAGFTLTQLVASLSHAITRTAGPQSNSRLGHRAQDSDGRVTLGQAHAQDAIAIQTVPGPPRAAQSEGSAEAAWLRVVTSHPLFPAMTAVVVAEKALRHFAPSTYHTLHCVGAALPVLERYNWVKRKVGGSAPTVRSVKGAKGPALAGHLASGAEAPLLGSETAARRAKDEAGRVRAAEEQALWHWAHRRAAISLHGLLTQFHARPQLGQLPGAFLYLRAVGTLCLPPSCASAPDALADGLAFAGASASFALNTPEMAHPACEQSAHGPPGDEPALVLRIETHEGARSRNPGPSADGMVQGKSKAGEGRGHMGDVPLGQNGALQSRILRPSTSRAAANGSTASGMRALPQGRSEAQARGNAASDNRLLQARVLEDKGPKASLDVRCVEGAGEAQPVPPRSQGGACAGPSTAQDSGRGGGALLALRWGCCTVFERIAAAVALVLRAMWLALLFSPLLTVGTCLLCLAAIAPWQLRQRSLAAFYAILVYCLRHGGAAFIKWAQWSSTRRDLFPDALCEALGALQDQAPEHSFRQTCRALRQDFGCAPHDLFEHISRKPLASGSIAQVHRARLHHAPAGFEKDVAVKVRLKLWCQHCMEIYLVRHPGVATRLEQDFLIMGFVAALLNVLPLFSWLRLPETVRQFSHTMTSQADLRVEAAHLWQTGANFAAVPSVVIPAVLPGMATEQVIVETFERGQPLHVFLRSHSRLNAQIAAAGVDTYLKMLLQDNFVHLDLHPGNILARLSSPLLAGAVRGGEGGADQQQQEQEEEDEAGRLQLVLLDWGLALELTPSMRAHFLSFLVAVAAGCPARATAHLLRFSEPHEQLCPDPAALNQDMENLFRRECDIENGPVDLDVVLRDVLRLCCVHHVTVDGEYASLLVAVCVLVGFAKSLDPELSIIDAAVPCLFVFNLTGQVMGRIYGG